MKEKRLLQGKTLTGLRDRRASVTLVRRGRTEKPLKDQFKDERIYPAAMGQTHAVLTQQRAIACLREHNRGALALRCRRSRVASAMA